MNINDLSEANLKALEKGILSTKNVELCIMFAEEAIEEDKDIDIDAFEQIILDTNDSVFC